MQRAFKYSFRNEGKRDIFGGRYFNGEQAFFSLQQNMLDSDFYGIRAESVGLSSEKILQIFYKNMHYIGSCSTRQARNIR